MPIRSLESCLFAFLAIAAACSVTASAMPDPPPPPSPSPSSVSSPAFVPNLLTNAIPASWVVGETPPKPWQTPNAGPEVTTEVVERNGYRWVELKDGSSEKSASLRQQFQPIKAGRFSFRIAVADDHVGQLGIFLGQGNASSEVERILELKVDSRGILLMGSAGKREKTTVSLSPGTNDHLFIEFATSNEDLKIRLGRIGKDGTDILIAETTVPQQGYAVSRLRIATDLAPRGGHFYVTDLVLTAPPAVVLP